MPREGFSSDSLCSPMSAPELTLSWAQSVSDVTLPMARSLREQRPQGQSPELQLDSWVWYKGNRLPDERFHVLDPLDVAFTCLTQVLACSRTHSTWKSHQGNPSPDLALPTRIPDTRPLPNNGAQLANRGAILTLSHRHLLLRFSLQMK